MKTLAVCTLLLFLTIASVSAIPVSFELGGAYHWGGTAAVMQVDRSLWEAGGTLFTGITDQVTAGAGYRAGGILYQSSGHAFLSGPHITLRYHIGSSIYIGAEGALLTAPSFRNQRFKALTIYSGTPLRLGKRVSMINELRILYLFTETPLLAAGVSNAVRFQF